MELIEECKERATESRVEERIPQGPNPGLFLEAGSGEHYYSRLDFQPSGHCHASCFHFAGSELSFMSAALLLSKEPLAS
eukprot:scaffold402_cov70-Skeletonema_dohrnii-CCMP3373.AAC.4